MTSPPSSPVAKGTWVLILVIVATMVLLSLYANVQRWRRDKIETVTVIPVASFLSPSASPR